MEAKTELQKNAIARARRHELETFQRALDIQWLNSRMEDGRMGRCLALIQREAEMEKDFQERTDHAAIVNERAKRETALGLEVAKVKREEACELLRRHYLRERDPSLRELTRKMQAGYVCRDIRQQILHNEYKKLQEKAEESHANAVLVNALYNDKDAKEREDREKMERCMQYCKDLQQQLVSRQREKQCQYEETLIEKKMLEEIMRTIADEDQRELQQKRYLTEKLRQEMVTFKQASDAWREKQKQMVVIEERQIEQQKKAAADRSAAVIAERQRKIQMKDELSQKIADKILADESARQERSNLIKLLQEQELLEKNCQDDIGGREKYERVKKDTLETLTAQMETRKRLAREQRESDLRFRKETEAKVAAEDEKEREKVRKKKEQGRLYQQELLKQVRDNAEKRAKDLQMEQARARYVWDYQDAWLAEVSEERRKIVEEHAPPLLGYLQAGVLRPADIPAVKVGAERRDDLRHLNIDSMTSGKGPGGHPKCNVQCTILREY